MRYLFLVAALAACVGLAGCLTGCATTTVTNPDGSTTTTTTLEPWAQDLAHQLAQAGGQAATQWITEALEDTPDPLTPEEQARLEQNAALRQAVIEAILAQIQWVRDHPGQALPEELAGRLSAKRAAAAVAEPPG